MGWIDVHAHLPTEPFLKSFGRYGESLATYFHRPFTAKPLDQILADFDAAGIEKAVILGWDAETATGLPPVSNDYVAEIVGRYPDRFIGFAGVDPHKGDVAVKELERAVQQLGLQGVKLHPVGQAFFPHEKQYYPLYEKAVELDIPILIHMGMAAWGAGLPGGGKVKLKYSDPMFVDDVAADFPELRILAAHPAWPWQDEMIAVALHKPNVYIDLSGWLPRYFPPVLVQYVKTLLKEKCMAGSDYPFIDPNRWIREFRALDWQEEVKEMILTSNAKKFLRL